MTKYTFKGLLVPVLLLYFVMGALVASIAFCTYIAVVGGDVWYLPLFISSIVLVLGTYGTACATRDLIKKIDKSLVMTREDLDNETDTIVGLKKRRFGKYVDTKEMKKLRENTN